ncbi:protein transporter sec31 [uncultured Mediterranean phage uvMED]|nr:protein transporter sec31 [uncultured Mediterranean phage uvMED]
MADTPLNENTLDFFKQFEDSTKKIEPVNSGLITNPDEEDFNFWEKTGRLSLSAAQGVVNAVEETGDFIDENIVTLGGLEFGDEDGKATFKDLIPKYVSPTKWKAEEYSKKRQLPIFHQPEGLAENMTEGATRFVTGFIGPNKFFKAVGLSGGLLKTGLRGMASGGVSDLTVFDPNEGRLSDMLVEFDSPVLNNAVTQYLATDEDDTEMEGRVKNVLEGMLIGGPFEILFGLKAFKKAKATKDLAEKEKIYKETGDAINDLRKGKKTKKVYKKIAENNPAINMKEYLKKLNIGQKEAKKETESFIKKILNTKSLKNSAQVLKTIDDVAERFDETTKDFLQNDVLKNSEAEELATLMSRDKGEILKSLPKEGERAKTATVRMIASKQILQELAFQLKQTSEQYVKQFGKETKNWTKQAKEDVALQAQVVRDTVVGLKNQIRGAARVTQAGNIKVVRSEGKILNVEELVNIIKNFEGDSATMAKLIKDAPLEEVVNKVSKSKYQRIQEAFNSAYINSLLSGVFTQAINIKSGVYEALIRPLEQIAGGALRADSKAIQLGFAQYKGLMMHFGEVVEMTRLALKQGDAILDPLSRTQDNLEIVGGKAIRPISGANLGVEGAAGTAIDWVGKVIEFPSRLLMTGDEFLKQSNYRARLFSNAVDNTMTRGLDIQSKAGRENIDKIFKEGFTKNGAANIKESSINQNALQYAREATYTNDLMGGSYLNIGSHIQTFLNAAPIFRFLAPFIRTPTNLWRHMSNRIPGLGAFTKQNRMMWNSGDRRARAEVLGRQLLGTSVVMYGLHLATEDVEDKNGKRYPKITGNGPSNFQVKKTWLSLGWQPYSIAQVKDDGTVTYKQYNRMDPRFMVLGFVADIKENIANINDQEKEEMLTAGIMTIMRNASNKTYLRGITDAMSLIGSPTEKKFEQFFGGVVGNLIPYASLRNQGIPGILEPETDAFETRSFLDKILERSGLGEKYLEPRRDIITGEPIEKTPSSLYFNPEGVVSFSSFVQGPSLVGRQIDVKDNPVAYEIARLRIALTPPQKIKSRTVDLTEFKKDNQSAYDYLMENTGKVKINGRTFQEEVINQMDSTFYKNRQEGDVNFDGGKEMVIKKVFKAYKDAAYAQMIKNYPEVKDAIIKAQKQKYELLGKSKEGESDQINVLLPQ